MEVRIQELSGNIARIKPPPLQAITSRQLRQLALFQGVECEILDALAPQFCSRVYKPGSIILQQGEPVSKFRLLSRGIVELVRLNGDHDAGVLLLSASDLIMPSAAAFGEPTLVTVRGLTAAKVMEIDAIAVRAALSRSTRLSANLMKAISGQWRMAVRNILDLNSRNAAQRLGAFLLRLADLLEEDGGSAVLPIPKRHLALRLGITPETLSRILQMLAAQGLYLRGRTIIVRDRSAIEQFCGPDPYEKPNERALSVFAI